MARDKSLPRLLQPFGQARPPAAQPKGWPSRPGMDKGDHRTQVDVRKPSKEREIGDLERAEREDHPAR